MSDDMREVFDKGLAQAFPVAAIPRLPATVIERAEQHARDFGVGYVRIRDGIAENIPPIEMVVIDRQAPPVRASKSERFTTEDIAAQQELLDAWKGQGREWGPIRYADVQSLLDEVKASRAISASTEYDAAMWERVADFADHGAPDDRAVPGERIIAAKRACEGKGAVSQRWDACARLAYSKERRARGGAHDEEHATMAEAVAAVTSASLTLARIERKVDALGNPPREPANITPSWWVGADVDSIARAVAEMVHIGNVESVRASRTMLAVACVERVGMTLADVARTAESVKPVPSVADLSEDVERVAREVGIRVPFDLEDPDNTPAKRIRYVVAQLVERVRAVVPAGEVLTGVYLIVAERARQVTAEGWTPEHDDEHRFGELAIAAAWYARLGTDAAIDDDGEGWRSIADWIKPTPGDRIRELVKAGALIAAEIDRLKRAGAKAP